MTRISHIPMYSVGYMLKRLHRKIIDHINKVNPDQDKYLIDRLNPVCLHNK